VAVVYSILIAMVVYRKVNARQLFDIIVEAAVISSVVMIILGLSVAFGRIMTQYRIPQFIAAGILDYSTNKLVILLLIDALLLFLGTFMETGPIIIIFGPLLLPLCKGIGLDAIYLGILICLATEIGFMTPPLGQNLFVAQKIGNLGLGEIFKPCIPLLLAQTGVLVLLNLFPGLGTMFIH
jgi:C4-dicarboxylate transporter DctM subunit